MKVSKVFPSRLDDLPKCIDDVMRQIKEKVKSEQDLFQVRLCIQEALVNAVKHGNKLNSELKVQLDIEISDEFLEINIIDEGQGFNDQELEDPTEEKNLNKLSGRGVFLIKRKMDKVKFFDKGRGIKMIKFLGKENHCEH